MKKIILCTLIVVIFGLTSCTTQMNIARSSEQVLIQSIALMPGGGVLADSIGVELLQYGYNIFDTSSVTSIMLRNNLNEAEIMLPVNLLHLKNSGIDAVLNIRTVAGYDGKPQSASFRLVSTEKGSVVCGGSWNNAAAGAQGSIADAIVRKDLSGAAREIASAIAKAIGN